jgi:hypothetical protein
VDSNVIPYVGAICDKPRDMKTFHDLICCSLLSEHFCRRGMAMETRAIIIFLEHRAYLAKQGKLTFSFSHLFNQTRLVDSERQFQYS